MTDVLTTETNELVKQLLLTKEVEQFLYAEAELLDERRFEDWLELLTEDIRYWMPMRRNIKFGDWEREDTRERKDINWIDEGKTTLTQRVKQILTGIHWAEEPLSRVCHIVSNVQVVAISPAEGTEEVTVKSRFLIYRNRVETETDFFVGKREDVLRRVGRSWKIARRKIVLDQNVLLAKNLTIFF
jgi:3-phenylpropionate/cinnamic acid dioxygenase small subunit